MSFCSHQTSSSPYIYNAGSSQDYREITLSLVGGVDISFVDPELYSNLLPYLDRYILKYQDRDDVSSINRLKFCKEYICSYPERERIAKLLTKRKKDPPPEKPPFNPEQLDDEIDKLLNSKKIDSSNTNYSPKEIDQLLTEMRTRRIEAAEDEDFDLADRLAFVSSQLSRQGTINQIRKIKNEQAEELKQKLEETKQTYSDLKERWVNLQINFMEETTKELNQMKEKHKKEMLELEKKRDGPIPPKYRKYSSEYLNLKQEEKMLVSSKRFDEATIVQQRVRKQEELENRFFTEEWHNTIDKDIKRLSEKHKQQIRVREMNIKKEQDNIVRTKKKELDALKNKIMFLENQINKLECNDFNSIVNNNCVSGAHENDGEDNSYSSFNDACESENEKVKPISEDDENADEIFFTKNNKTETIEFIEEEENNENVSNSIQVTDDESNASSFAIHPPSDDQNQRTGYKKRNKKRKIDNPSSSNENKNTNLDERNDKKTSRIRSSGYPANSFLPQLKMANKNRTPRNNKNGPEAFRQRALLNKQIYCGKTLLSQHVKNQKERQRKKKRVVTNESLD